MVSEKRLIWDEDAKRHLIALAVGHHTETLHIDMILNAILHHTPAVDAVEVVHGRWIKDGDVVVCSNCGEEHAWDEYRATYCEDCGAKMDGGDEDGNT